jgi:hypothetical protein
MSFRLRMMSRRPPNMAFAANAHRPQTSERCRCRCSAVCSAVLSARGSPLEFLNDKTRTPRAASIARTGSHRCHPGGCPERTRQQTAHRRASRGRRPPQVPTMSNRGNTPKARNDCSIAGEGGSSRGRPAVHSSRRVPTNVPTKRSYKRPVPLFLVPLFLWSPPPSTATSPDRKSGLVLPRLPTKDLSLLRRSYR